VSQQHEHEHCMRVQVDVKLLRDLLYLPEDAEIVGAGFDRGSGSEGPAVELWVRHHVFPKVPECVEDGLPFANPQYSREGGKPIFVGWGLSDG